MLFDLRGRRRRAVQATYLMLAVLMGGGLVLFGIGGDVSGGLVDAFKGGGGGSSGDSALRDQAERQEERLAKNPQNPVVLQNLVRDYYSLATGQRESGTVGFPADAKDELRKAGEYWQRYTQAVADEAGRRRRPLRPSGLRRRWRSTARRRRRRRRRSSPRSRTTWRRTSGSSVRRPRGRHPDRRSGRQEGGGPRAEGAAQGGRAAGRGAQEAATGTASGRLTYPTQP